MTEKCVGKVAVVTGASRGLGRGIAIRLAAEGAKVVVTGRTLRPGSHELPGSLEETVGRIEDIGGEAVAIQANLADPSFDRADILRAAADSFGRDVDILVNNAAAPREFQHRFQDVPLESFLQTVEVNGWAAWELTKLVAPGMARAGRGWVVNISSRAAGPPVGPPFRPSPVGSQTLYGSTKAMLDRITAGAAMDLYGDGICVNALAPEAAVATENASRLLDLPPEMCEPDETFAEAALALCTCDRDFTGKVTYSLSLLVDLNRPVRTLDGKQLVEGWQPQEIDRARLRPGYIRSSSGRA